MAKHLPTYQELADIVSLLTEVNVANLDHGDRAMKFVSCFTYSTGVIPDHWKRAMRAREALISHNVIPRTVRRGRR